MADAPPLPQARSLYGRAYQELTRQVGAGGGRCCARGAGLPPPPPRLTPSHQPPRPSCRTMHQVGVACEERGRVMADVWLGYSTMFDRWGGAWPA